MPPSGAEGFAGWFEQATGHEPYAYQLALGAAAEPPEVLEVPTGAGKTQAMIVSWLYGRRVRKSGPRRLVYALPMRTLVEQTVDVARDIRERLSLAEEELPIRTLMGGSDGAELRDWRQWPDRDQLLVGTIDMLLSRALNRGYAESRFAWPISFGLLNNDCRWVFDEVQLMGSARATSAQLDGLRAKLGVALPCETTWMSATVDQSALETVDRPELGQAMALPEEDRSGALHGRLHAVKTLERLDMTEVAGGELASHIARSAMERHVPGTRTLIVLNTVGLGQATYTELKRLTGGVGVETVMLHSRFRPMDRRGHMERALAAPDAAGTIVVATQVVEAGVDVSARTLITETAPFSSIVQRLGRCNRAGEYGEATVVWLDRGNVVDDAAGRKSAAPYRPADITAARAALSERVGTSLSPAAVEMVNVKESADDPALLRRRDLLDLFDTSPDLSGMDIDIAPFIREDDDRTVTVLFRALGTDAPAQIVDQPGPERHELVQVPRGSLGKRICWMTDYVDGGWTRRQARDVPAGAVVMLRAADGGYAAEIGWDGRIKGIVDAIPLTSASAPEGFGSDYGTETGEPEALLSHLTKVAHEAAHLAATLDLPAWADAMRAAGALHDIGKAHPVFQKTLRAAMAQDGGEDPLEDDGRLWAKSGRSGGRHERPYFRHELASALATRGLDGQVPVPARDLTTYLIAAHHGKVRLSIRPAPDETRPQGVDANARFALGVVDGDVLPEMDTPLGTIPAVRLDLAAMELGADDSWTDASLRLRDDPELGPFRLAFMEALLRIADWTASGA